MLTISNLTYRIQGRTLIGNADLSIMDGWKVGLVGANGVGKSTLFKLIAGELQADSGNVELSDKYRLGWVRQDIPSDDTSLLDIVLAADEERTALLQASETETDPYKIAEIHTRLSDIDAYSAPARAAMILSGLGFSDAQLSDPISSFSGGWRMRVALAAALFQQPEVLLLDEPTNHLDLEAIMWLENYLPTYPHNLIVISHDRTLLNQCVDHIAHIENKSITLYTGNYDTFEKERAEKRSHQHALYEKQQAQRAHMQAYIDRFRAKASKAKQAQSRIKALERMDLVDAVIADRTRAFIFPQPEELAPPLLGIDHVDIGYTPGNPVLTNVHERIDMDDRIALLGANGNGKSTLIKLIAGKLAPMKGELFHTSKLRIGYFSQHQAEELDLDGTPYLEMKRRMPQEGEAKVRAKLGQFGFNKELSDNKISALSGGEKARLLFAFMSFNAPHILLLDEPTNHLDMDAREGLIKALNAYQGAVVIVSHDPGMVERVADRLWLVDRGEVHPFDGDLDAYRQHVLESRRAAKKEEKPVKEKAKLSKKEKRKLDEKKRKHFAPLYQNVKDAENQVKQLTTQRKEAEALMATPDFYANEAEASATQQRYATLLKEIDAAESTWMDAQEVFEAAELPES